MEKEVIEYLNAGKGGSFLDCTLGGGGHKEQREKKRKPSDHR